MIYIICLNDSYRFSYPKSRDAISSKNPTETLIKTELEQPNLRCGARGHIEILDCARTCSTFITITPTVGHNIFRAVSLC